MELIFITRVQKILRSSRKQASFKKGDRHNILVCVVYFSNNKFPYDVGVETGKQFFGTLNLFKWLKNAPRSTQTVVQKTGQNPHGFHRKSANPFHKKSATRTRRHYRHSFSDPSRVNISPHRGLSSSQQRGPSSSGHCDPSTSGHCGLSSSQQRRALSAVKRRGRSALM